MVFQNMPAETEKINRPFAEDEEKINWLLICTQFSETYLRSLDSHELDKLYRERITDRQAF